jgi:hypothetical protein
MKRYALALLAAGGLAGCQSPGGGLGMHSPGQQNWSPRPMYAQAKPTAPAAPTPSADARNPQIQQVGYNTGWGAIQNNNFAQKVGRAVPSHGGMLPGGLEFPGPGGMPAGPRGMPGGPSGCAHGYCAPGAGGPTPGIPGSSLMPRFSTGRTQVRFVRPTGMEIAWQSGGQFTPPQLQAPARYNFAQARIYRLKLTNIPNRAGLELYPTLEIYPGNTKVDAYLAHNAVPVEITEEDLDQVSGGNFVTKVIYLPDPKFQELAIAGVETLVSTRLDPGVDPIQEASRRGAILAVLRMGSVDLEMPHSPDLFPTAPAPAAVGSPNGMELNPIPAKINVDETDVIIE